LPPWISKSFLDLY